MAVVDSVFMTDFTVPLHLTALAVVRLFMHLELLAEY